MTTTMTIAKAVPPRERPTPTPSSAPAPAPPLPSPVEPLPAPQPAAPSTPAPAPHAAPSARSVPRTQGAPAHPAQPTRPCFPSTLTFSPEAWIQLQFLCHAGGTEIGAFGIAARDNPFHIIALGLPRQTCSAVTVEFDDASVADFFDDQIDRGRTPDQFARVWIHTHPGNSAEPSGIDEETFARVFGRCDWAVMFILAKGGATTCRLRMTSQGVKDRRFALDKHLNVRVAWEDVGDASVISALEPWWFEYMGAVEQVHDFWNQHESSRPRGDGGEWGAGRKPPVSGTEKDLLDWFDDLDPAGQRAFLEDMHGEDEAYDRHYAEYDDFDDRDVPRGHWCEKGVHHAE